MRIAEFSESSKFWTHIALSGYAWKYACISVRTTNLPFFFCVVSDWDGRCEVSRVFLALAGETRVPLNVRWFLLCLSEVWCSKRSDLSGSLCALGTSVRAYEGNLFWWYVRFRPDVATNWVWLSFFPWGSYIVWGLNWAWLLLSSTLLRLDAFG
jgi:hypothetical protein